MISSVYLIGLLFLITVIAFQYDAPDNIVKRVPNEINVIIFLVNSSDSETNNCDTTTEGDEADGTKLLNFSKATVIVPCTPEKEAQITGSVNRILRYSQNSCDCKNLLKNSLKSLIGYASNSMGLTTAVSSLTAETNMKPKAEFVEVNKNNKNNNILQFEQDEPNQESEPFQSEGQYDPNRWPSVKTKRDPLSQETVEVFNITSGLKEKRQENREIVDIPLPNEKPKTMWDMLGLMKTIRQSFFDNFFTPVFDPQRSMIDEEDGLNLELLGRVQEPSMFELVRRTLREVQNHKSDNGFLMTFFGGNICDIKNPRSDLMQSIKHVLENSDEENTLTVLTGSCPKEGRIGNDEGGEIPLYVRGPRSDVFRKAKELYDVPKLVKVAMMEHHESKKRQNKLSREENH